MKNWRYIFLGVFAVIGLSVFAQEPQVYVVDTVIDTVRSQYPMTIEYQEVCSNHVPQLWRQKAFYTTGTYYDTAHFEQFFPHEPIIEPLTKDTTVHDILRVVDTIYTLDFTVNPTFSIERKLELRKGAKVEIRGKWYDAQGTYYDTIPSSTGCDSILTINIVWAESFRQIETREICEGNSIVWHGKTLSEEGIYWDSLTTTQGYDSVYQIYLYLHRPFSQKDTATVCFSQLDKFRWQGMRFTQAGDYSKIYIDHLGCDSTYYLHLVVPQASPVITFTEYFCRNQGFVWPKTGGTRYFVQKTFTQTYTNLSGCDSVVTYRFIPRDNDFHTTTIQHYAGDAVLWRDSTYAIDSIYQDTLINQYGCDSIIELRLVTKYDFDRNIIRCQGDTAMFHKEVIRANCDRNDTLKTKLGGDSIIHYHFSFQSPFYSREYVTLCSNEYFEWTGHYDKMGNLMVLHEEGSYYDRHRNAAGCDSTYEVIVKHSPAWIHDSLVIICNDTNDVYPAIWFDSKGKKYEWHCNYLDTTICDTMRHTIPLNEHFAVGTDDFIPISGGCDSIFRYRILITDRCSELDSIPLCQGDKKWIDGRQYDQPGRYSNWLPSKTHPELMLSDSLHTFEIYTVYPDTTTDTVTVCESKLPFKYNNGQKFTSRQSGDYKVHFTNRYGCDSLVNLHINVVPTLYSPWNNYDQYCPGDEIHIETPTGKIFTTTGDFTDTVVYGDCQCDSVIRYHIVYKPSFFHYDSVFMRRQDTFTWKGHHNDIVYDSAGVYYDSCKNVYNCDSVYRLRIIYAEPFYKEEVIHTCSNQLPYIWHKKTVNESGVYWDSLKTVYKLDSVYKATIIIDSAYYDTIYRNFCYGDYFELNGKKISASGTYSYTLQSETGCDSVITYVLNFSKTTIQAPQTVHIAEGATYTWRGHVFDKAGTYFDTIRTNRIYDGGHRCDSIIYSLKLYVEHPFFKEETPKHVCSNQLPVLWRGKSINKSGVYWDSLKSVYQLDSVYKLTVYVDSAYTKSHYYHLCEGDAFTLRDKNYTSSGMYLDTLVSECGCDSVIHHIVHFTSAGTANQEIMHCLEGQSVIWHGKEYATEGLYFDTLRNEWGCDSIRYSMLLFVEHSFFRYDSIVLCNNEFPYAWHNRNLHTAGIYWDSCRTSYGLDSVYKLRIDTLPTSFTSFTKTMCKGDSYNFGTQVITESGVYVDHQFNSNGCDSLIRCIVNYAPQYLYTEKMSFVDESELPILWHGKELTHEGYFYDSLTTAEYGCDSVHQVYLRKSQSYFFSEQKELCDSKMPYFWQGQYRTEAGVYTASYSSWDGRDSIYQLTLIVHPSEMTVMNEYICPGGSFSLYGKTYSQPGIYRDTMYTDEGCYSITELRLNAYNVVTSNQYHQLCPGDTLYINGKAVTRSGTYDETIQSQITGCDSIIRHIVSYHTAFYQTETKTINAGDVYTWHKNGTEWQLTETGTYFDSCRNQFGCDSIYRLELTVNQVEYHFPTEVVNICENMLPYVWHNVSFYTDTLATAAYKTKLGRDSIYTLDLHVSRTKDSLVYLTYCEGERPSVNGRIYTSSSLFVDTLTDTNGCDSVRIHYTINFYPRYSLTKLIELKHGETYLFGDTVIASSGIYYRHFTTVNGCDSLVTLKVETCENIKETMIHKDLCEGETFILNGEEITKSDRYYSFLKTADGCDSIVTYLVNFHPSFNNYTAASICHGDSYKWFGHFNDTLLNKAGIYVDSIPTESGCYNTYTLHLSYKNQDWDDTIVSMCADELPYIYKGVRYYVDTVFYDTLGTNVNGCDSILRWHYEVNRHCSTYDQYRRCTSEIKYIEGLLVDHAGVYSVNRLTEQGEDSVYRFIVHDVQPYEKFTTLAPICDSVVYNGKVFRARGGNATFREDFNLRTVDGCDSIEHVTFTIHPSSPKYVQYATIADYETYRFEGRDYNLPGTYPVWYFNQYMCDSVRELVLNVLTTQYEEPVHYAFCQGDRTGLHIFGKTYYPTRDTVIADTIRLGGIPTIRTAVVDMHHPFTITKFDPHADQLVCSSAQELWFDVSYAVKDQGALPQHYDVDFVTGDLDAAPKHATYNVTSPTTLSIKMDGRGMFVNPGTYGYRIKFHTDSCTYSDTTFMGSVTVNYPAEIMKGKWDNLVTLLNADYNGGEWNLQPPYVWLVRDKFGNDKTAAVAPSSNAQSYIASDRLTDGDQVQVLLYREGYTKPVWSCPFVFESNGPSTQNPIAVYPTTAMKKTAVHVQTQQQGDYQLYNTTGHVYQRGKINCGTNLVTMPNSEGCYLLKVTTQDGSETLERIIVY